MMEEYLMRNDAPFSAEEWAKLDGLVVGVAKKLLVGRRVVEVFGPLGAGTQMVQVSQYHVTAACQHTGDDVECGDDCCDCGGDCDAIDVEKRLILSVPFIHKDFVLRWLDVASAKQNGLPVDFGPAGAAAAMVANKEDEMVFGAMLSQEGRTTVKATDWSEPGSVFANLVSATTALAQNGFFGPYTVVVSPAVYAMLHRPMQGGMGMLEIKQAKELASGGVYQTPALQENQAIVVSQGVQNMDLAVAQDLTTAYLGPERMDHVFRVMESLVLRVKRPGAICTIE
jgi:uncharacterized linocin/CFP29 family protein